MATYSIEVQGADGLPYDGGRVARILYGRVAEFRLIRHGDYTSAAAAQREAMRQAAALRCAGVQCSITRADVR